MNIEKGVPLPSPGSGDSALRGLSDILRRMEVNDSVFLSGQEDTKLSIYYSRLPEKKFTARKTLGGVRIWRVS